MKLPDWPKNNEDSKSASQEERCRQQEQKDKITTDLLSTIEQEMNHYDVTDHHDVETPNQVLPQHACVASRDLIFGRLVRSRVETLRVKFVEREERRRTEERWRNSWVKTLEDICSFYE